MRERIEQLQAEGAAAIAAAGGTDELERARIAYLGRKAELPNLLRGVAQLAPEERGQVGRAANEARRALEVAIEERRAALEAAELHERLERDVVDVTLPGSPSQPVGRLHVLTAVRRELEDVFIGLGFRVVEGPEVDTVYYNFDALNHDAVPPAGGTGGGRGHHPRRPPGHAAAVRPHRLRRRPRGPPAPALLPVHR